MTVELIELARQSMHDVLCPRSETPHHYAPCSTGSGWVLEGADAVLAAVEPVIRADEQERLRHWSGKCRNCGSTHRYEDYAGERRAHERTTGMAPAMGYMCVCGRWVPSTSEWHDHLTGVSDD